MNNEIKLTYTDAVSEDAELLTATAHNSKKFWGYSDALMELWKEDLEINTDYILKNKVVKVFENKNFIGFFALKTNHKEEVEIDHLWLLPDKIKRGYGRSIFQHILNYVKTQGYKKVTLIAEPNAKGFYEKMNGRVVGMFQSKINNRLLDIYQFD